MNEKMLSRQLLKPGAVWKENMSHYTYSKDILEKLKHENKAISFLHV